MTTSNLFATAGPTTKHPLRVLVVDDEPIITAELRAMLIQMGHQVETARTYRQAQQQIDAFRPDLVLLDIYLGETKTGLDLARQLQQQGIGFLFMSAHSDSFTLERASQLDPLGYLLKPFTERRVFVKVEMAADKISQPDMPVARVGVEDVFLTSTLEEVESVHIRTVLAKTGGRIRGRDGAAELLGLHPNTLQSRLDKLGIDKRAFE